MNCINTFESPQFSDMFSKLPVDKMKPVVAIKKFIKKNRPAIDALSIKIVGSLLGDRMVLVSVVASFIRHQYGCHLIWKSPAF